MRHWASQRIKVPVDGGATVAEMIGVFGIGKACKSGLPVGQEDGARFFCSEWSNYTKLEDENGLAESEIEGQID